MDALPNKTGIIWQRSGDKTRLLLRGDEMSESRVCLVSRAASHTPCHTHHLQGKKRTGRGERENTKKQPDTESSLNRETH